MDFDLEVNENGLDSFELVFPLAYRIAFMVVFGESIDFLSGGNEPILIGISCLVVGSYNTLPA